MSDVDLMLWLDLETNGDDVVNCEVLEVGAFFTDAKLNKLEFPALDMVIHPTALGLQMLFQNDYVVDMHAKSGLLKAIAGQDALSIETAKNYLDSWLKEARFKFIPENREARVQLAGSGVASFDQQVLRYWHPDVFKKLYYACFDVGHFRRFVGASNNEELEALVNKKEDIPHRAMQDIQNHWEEAKRYLTYLDDVAWD